MIMMLRIIANKNHVYFMIMMMRIIATKNHVYFMIMMLRIIALPDKNHDHPLIAMVLHTSIDVVFFMNNYDDHHNKDFSCDY